MQYMVNESGCLWGLLGRLRPLESAEMGFDPGEPEEQGADTEISQERLQPSNSYLNGLSSFQGLLHNRTGSFLNPVYSLRDRAIRSQAPHTTRTHTSMYLLIHHVP